DPSEDGGERHRAILRKRPDEGAFRQNQRGDQRLAALETGARLLQGRQRWIHELGVRSELPFDMLSEGLISPAQSFDLRAQTLNCADVMFPTLGNDNVGEDAQEGSYLLLAVLLAPHKVL